LARAHGTISSAKKSAFGKRAASVHSVTLVGN
jgi:hypothetical protein